MTNTDDHGIPTGPIKRRGTHPLDPSWAFPGYTRADIEETLLDAFGGPVAMPQPVRYYISGPMAGYQDHNFPFFERVKREMLRQGLDILSPHDIDHAAETVTREQFLATDLIHMIQQCDGIIMAGNWLDSWGAGFELNVAAKLGFDILLYNRYTKKLHSGEGLRRYVH